MFMEKPMLWDATCEHAHATTVKLREDSLSRGAEHCLQVLVSSCGQHANETARALTTAG
jgi:hypothetical protein